MPLVQRVVQPVDIVRIPLSKHLKGNDELQHVNMNALVGIIRQLSSLSAHAETLFADLFNEASRTAIKARHMERRVQSLAEKISAINPEVPKADLNTQNVESGRFRPNTVVDQNVVMKENRTPCVKERHSAADATPALIVFKNLRDDGKDCTTLYTDPHYFGKAWFVQMQKEFEANKRARTKKKNKKQSVKKEPRPVIIKEYKVDALGNRIVTEAQIRKVDTTLTPSDSDFYPQSDLYPHAEEGYPIEGESTPPPLQPVHIVQPDTLPPPPDFDYPAPLPHEESFPPPQMNVPMPSGDEPVYDEPVRSRNRVPPPPCAPPAPTAPLAPRAPPAPGGPRAPPAAPATPRPTATPPPSKPANTTSPKPPSFLDSIQQYSLNTLKKVTVEPKQESHYASMDVMSILSRRPVMQWSDSDTDSDSSDQDWDGEE